ncbi:MAG TPA: Crp/Fnr family transcriptional regulator [Candidatus Hydrogenedens sp.]|nr:Crp/Fnr family transcriptional regulator [Candidatus Hydrogenedens sp.]
MQNLNERKEFDKIIENDSFFSHLSNEFKENIKRKIHLRTYDKNQIIYFPKEKITHVYIVHKGKIRITRVSENGKVVTFRHVITGDIFGDEALLSKKQREEYAEAITKSEVWLMPLMEFLKGKEENHIFAKLYEKKLLERAKEYEETFADSVFYSAINRVARKIIREIKREINPTKKLVITHQELANLLGIRRETITVCLKILEKEGFIEKKKGSIIIKNQINFENWIEKNNTIKGNH